MHGNFYAATLEALKIRGNKSDRPTKASPTDIDSSEADPRFVASGETRLGTCILAGPPRISHSPMRMRDAG